MVITSDCVSVLVMAKFLIARSSGQSRGNDDRGAHKGGQTQSFADKYECQLIAHSVLNSVKKLRENRSPSPYCLGRILHFGACDLTSNDSEGEVDQMIIPSPIIGVERELSVDIGGFLIDFEVTIK